MAYNPAIGDTVTLVDPAKIEGPTMRERYEAYLEEVPELTPGQTLCVVSVTFLLVRVRQQHTIYLFYRWEIEPYHNLPRFDEAGAL